MAKINIEKTAVYASVFDKERKRHKTRHPWQIHRIVYPAANRSCLENVPANAKITMDTIVNKVSLAG